MPEQKLTYLQRVVIMAKRIQKSSPLVGHWTLYKEASKEAVAAQAEAIREYMLSCNEVSIRATNTIGTWLLEHGYAPKTEEDGTTKGDI